MEKEEPTIVRPNEGQWRNVPFLTGTIGAVVGFGSVWRFPAMVHGMYEKEEPCVCLFCFLGRGWCSVMSRKMTKERVVFDLCGFSTSNND